MRKKKDASLVQLLIALLKSHGIEIPDEALPRSQRQKQAGEKTTSPPAKTQTAQQKPKMTPTPPAPQLEAGWVPRPPEKPKLLKDCWSTPVVGEDTSLTLNMPGVSIAETMDQAEKTFS